MTWKSSPHINQFLLGQRLAFIGTFVHGTIKTLHHDVSSLRRLSKIDIRKQNTEIRSRLSNQHKQCKSPKSILVYKSAFHLESISRGIRILRKSSTSQFCEFLGQMSIFLCHFDRFKSGSGKVHHLF